MEVRYPLERVTDLHRWAHLPKVDRKPVPFWKWQILDNPITDLFPDRGWLCLEFGTWETQTCCPESCERAPLMKPRIRQFRKQQGLTQHAVSAAIGCQRSALSEWETGRRLVPPWYLWKLARCLHVTVDELYEYDDTSPPLDETTP